MEPNDIPVHDLLGAGGEPEAGPDELRAIVARAGRKRWGMAGTAAALALALGLGIGFATSSHSAPKSQTATAGPASGQNAPAAATPSAGASSGSSSGGAAYTNPIAPSTARFTRVFTRATGDVTIRAFLVTSPQIFGLPAGCGGGGSHLQVEVSTPKMVGTVGGGLGSADRSQPVSAISSQVVGTSESDPTAVVTAATGPGVGRVSMSFPGGATDAMTPVGGWVALAAPVAGSVSYGSNMGTLTERNAGGKVLKSQAVQLGVESSAMPRSGCSYVCPAIRPQTGATTKSAPANSPAANSGSTVPGVVCPPLPCSSVPRLTVPRESGQGSMTGQAPLATGSAAVNSGDPMVASAGGGVATFACPMPAGGSGGASGSSGVSP